MYRTEERTRGNGRYESPNNDDDNFNDVDTSTREKKKKYGDKSAMRALQSK